ncbi:glycoside hydrolase family 32 protein [Paraliobacillus sediminis]|uniref:glycoside hydrolase family 32 protein n=1 Tax=Paraliobacillus sediminis TaxID=1885916 RepID=UPI000E3C2646|nr:sucrose-6-phosphate hydrolase [Paraliobacillus sediminis]
MKENSNLDIVKDNQLKEQANAQVNEFSSVSKEDPFRLHYHVMPPVGLLNDPNGFIYFQGKYHLFFQWNPFATDHSLKYWAHVTSTDLFNWEWQPIALAPSDWFDKDGCYSGSAIEHEDKMYLFYTGNVRAQNGERESYQCLAISEDGIDFKKRGPLFTVPDGYTAHFRDPKVWRECDGWYLVIGAQTVEGSGCVLLYRSMDLINWDQVGEISTQDGDEFGYMWECPDFFYLGDKDVLMFSPQGIPAEGFHYQNIYQTGYLVGGLDRDTGGFCHQPFVELDAGFDFYAPQTTKDIKGRRLLFGWMGLPEEDEAYHPTKEYGWVHAMTLPRELSVKDGRLYQQPVEELIALRENEVTREHITIVNERVQVDSGNGKAFELMLDVQSFVGSSFILNLDGNTSLAFDKIENTLTLFRKSIKTNQQESRTISLTNVVDLQLFVDTSSLELFVNQGAFVFTSRLFDVLSKRDCYLEVDGQMNCSIRSWNLRQVTK